MKKRWWMAGAVVTVAVGAVMTLGATGRYGVTESAKRVVAAPQDREPAWAQRLALVEQALVDRNLSRATYEWREAYHAAIGSRQWEALVAVGEAAIQIDAAAGAARFHPVARQVYLDALLRARAQGSTEGVLRAVEAFERLGDQKVVEIGRRIARQIAERERPAPGRVDRGGSKILDPVRAVHAYE